MNILFNRKTLAIVVANILVTTYASATNATEISGDFNLTSDTTVSSVSAVEKTFSITGSGHTLTIDGENTANNIGISMKASSQTQAKITFEPDVVIKNSLHGIFIDGSISQEGKDFLDFQGNLDFENIRAETDNADIIGGDYLSYMDSDDIRIISVKGTTTLKNCYGHYNGEGLVAAKSLVFKSNNLNIINSTSEQDSALSVSGGGFIDVAETININNLSDTSTSGISGVFLFGGKISSPGDFSESQSTIALSSKALNISTVRSTGTASGIQLLASGLVSETVSLSDIVGSEAKAFDMPCSLYKNCQLLFRGRVIDNR